MEQEAMNVVLNQHGAELLRAARSRYPDMSAAEIVETALAGHMGSEQFSAPRIRTREEIRRWLDELASFSAKIPAMPGETFSREMIYQDHD